MADSYVDSLKEKKNENTFTTLKTLLTNVKESYGEPFWPEEEGWRQYIKDHFKEIKEKSTTIAVDPNEARKYCYSVEAYLKNLGYPRSISWIVMMINQLESNLHFDSDIQSILVPDTDQLRQYRLQYSTNRVQQYKELNTYNL